MKKLDFILVGATGFTGKRAARYLKNHAPDKLKWGIAGRSPEKLTSIANELNLSSDLIFKVDLHNKEQVTALTSATKCVITTAGPFSLYGENLIAACAQNGTHYLDITGEVGFIARMDEKYGDLAKENNAMIISFCGFDSIPAELLLLQFSELFPADDNVTIRSYYTISGGLNGGTLASMLNKFDSGEADEMSNPRLAMVESEQKTGKPEQPFFMGFDSRISRWSTPFIMSAVNSKVIYRSASLFRKFGTPVFEKITYSEHTRLGKKFKIGSFLSEALTLILLQSLLPIRFFRNLLKKFGPDPGEGPSEESIENGFIKVRAFGWSEVSGKQFEVECYFPGDAGNKATVFFLCETALLLAKNDFTGNYTGFLTPSTAFNSELKTHLKERGYIMNVLN